MNRGIIRIPLKELARLLEIDGEVTCVEALHDFDSFRVMVKSGRIKLETPEGSEVPEIDLDLVTYRRCSMCESHGLVQKASARLLCEVWHQNVCDACAEVCKNEGHGLTELP